MIPVCARHLLVVALVSTALASPAAAQTRFEWPDTTVDVSRYSTAEECLAATDRVRSGLERRDGLTVWRDTMPVDPRRALEPAPAPVRETAARCAARFPEPTAKLEDFAPLLALYLAAGRDADAAALLTRRMAAVPVKDARARAAVGDSAVAIYLDARPVRLDPAEQLLVARAHAGSDRVGRLALYARLMKAADNVGDTARAKRVARWVLAVADSLTPAERESEAFDKLGGGTGGKYLIFDAVQLIMGMPVMLDSLRSGTAALAALERTTWAQFTGERPEALPLPVGERAPTIAADYWIPREASATPRPAPGHVSMLLFLDHAGCLFTDASESVGDSCTSVLAGLHRVSERFPALEITIVTKTHGSFLYAPPMAPAEEAELDRKWLAPFRIPGAAIAVSNTPFWNLPPPDGRRINKDTPNMTSYSFGKSWKPQGTFLVDQDGIIVTAIGFDEPMLNQFIDVLLHRQGGADHAAK